ncbi:MAG: MATE family efflux transporter [Hyphomicrobiales bacterium]|nr:MATE family efflux transporter [Hyphomicrobiales bacterium]
MSAGSPSARPIDGPLGHRQVLSVAVPIILSNVTTPLIGVVDTAVLGQLGDPRYIGAVALGAMIFNMLYWAFSFLRMGTTGLTAQAEGGGRSADVAATLMRALLIAAAAGGGLILLQLPIGALAFWLLQGSDAVEASAHSYFTIRIWGAPAALINFAVLGWFIGMGRAGTAFALQILLNGTNAGLDALFVMGLGLEVEGVALGTVLAETLAAACGLWLARRELRRRGATFRRDLILEAGALKRTFAINADIMIRTLSVVLVFSWFTAQSASQGDVLLAANAILLHFTQVAAYFLDGFAFAAESFVGRAIGAGRRTRYREAVRITTLWAVVFSLGLSFAYWVGGGLIIDAMTVSPEVREMARTYLPWAVFVPVLGVVSYQLDGIFIGATRTADLRNMMLLSAAVYFAAWAVLTSAFDNHGLWAAQMLFFAVRGVTLGLRLPALERDAFREQTTVLAR